MRIRIDPILDKKMAWTSWYTSFSDAFKKRAGKIEEIKFSWALTFDSFTGTNVLKNCNA